MPDAGYGVLSVCDEPLCLFERLSDSRDRWQLLRIAVSLDELTAQILVKHFVDNRQVSRELLFQRNAPLERFWTRIELAFALGLISRPLKKALLLVCRLSEQILMTLRPGWSVGHEHVMESGYGPCACGRVPGTASEDDLSFRVQLFSSISLICAEMFAVEKDITRCQERFTDTALAEIGDDTDGGSGIIPRA
ncbi:hypothetical protein Mal4_06470 [Maioricimonas rarisocia]|uniref:Uncharacterized protein n=1 Tax=Maioricimonas rarisocia TaxID=2528026 RepID=A0A517Z1K6_9PLAN|nr:hypothetical protein [Maioricimonas rarisocia]QDU36362.1 hypothetical protein Mal4_06470 [Maioricimonas rarisocia]